ncbi:hypothetical protein LTR84_000095 [Exophiala bonariae]|uniref:Uncharacterized protein n=1 Tax=Exophiala bonariae TaxID=1690606 RepID=A0AAV9NSD7_9EURO|nr:hypothetical protein LTR84_000095 [Exophiala bonariae]
MSANSGNGGVRNLRAMFENKGGDQSTSPPSRGRSPNPSEFSNGSRPVSKVRASFVAVERPGENGGPPILGLRRASEVSSLGGIQENATMDAGHLERSSSVRTDADIRHDARPPYGRAQSSTNGTLDGGLGKILKGSAFAETPSKVPKTTSVTSNAKNLGEALSSGRLQNPTRDSPSKENGSANAATMVKNMKTDGRSGPPPPTTLQTTKSTQPIKPPPTRLATKSIPKSPVISKPSPKTPTSPVTSVKGGPAKIRGVMESAKQAQQARVESKPTLKQEKAPTAPKLDTKTKAKSTSEVTKKEKAPASPQVARSSKIIRAKSPTRPSRLPTAATANTASSAAKDTHLSPTEPDFRKPVTKKSSTLSIRQPRASVSSTTSTLGKKPSRASLVNGHDKHERPKSRVSVQASKPDEGFLARMMRPTTSSAQKTHDKVQVNSPPRPRTSTSHRPKDVTTKKAPPPPKTQLAKPQMVTNENEADKASHEDVFSPDETVQPPQLDVEEIKEGDAPVASESKIEVPQEPIENTPSLDPNEGTATEKITDDKITAEDKEELPTPTPTPTPIEEESHVAEVKEEVPNQTPIENISTIEEIQPESPIEGVEDRPEPVQENAVAV